MSRANVISAALFTIAIAATCPFVGSTVAQSRTYRAPRLKGTDKPNLNGLWQAVNTANWDVQGHAAQAGPASSVLGAYIAEPAGMSIVEGDAIPYQPWAAAKKEQNFKTRLSAEPDQDKRYDGDPELKCFLPGVPRVVYMPFPFQIIQSANGGVIMFAYEFAGAARPVNMAHHTDAPVDSWMGWSNGHWEGDTLVVDVTGFNGNTWFDRAGNFASDALHVVERYTPMDADHLWYEAAIEDSKVFTRPWKIRFPLYRRKEPNAQLLEFKCTEFSEELLYGRYRKGATQ